MSKDIPQVGPLQWQRITMPIRYRPGIILASLIAMVFCRHVVRPPRGMALGRPWRRTRVGATNPRLHQPTSKSALAIKGFIARSRERRLCAYESGRAGLLAILGEAGLRHTGPRARSRA